MSSNQGSSPVDNLTFDLITSLNNKLEAVTAYDKYLKDTQGVQQCHQIFQQLMQDDKKHVELLRQELTRHLNR